MRPPSAAQSRAVAVAPAPRGFPVVACLESIARGTRCLLLTHTSIILWAPASPRSESLRLERRSIGRRHLTMAVQTQTRRPIAGGSRISQSPAWALCALASRYKSSRTGPDELAWAFPPARPFIPRARRLRFAGTGLEGGSRCLSLSSTTVTQFAAISGYRVRRDYTAGTGIVKDLTDALDDDPFRRSLSYYSIGRIIRSSRRGAVVRRMQV